jgi:hypothetical protein
MPPQNQIKPVRKVEKGQGNWVQITLSHPTNIDIPPKIICRTKDEIEKSMVSLKADFESKAKDLQEELDLLK